MELIMIIAIYILGCVLAYGRCFATFYEIEEEYYMLPPHVDRAFIIVIALFSWVSVLGCFIKYALDSEKYLFKFTDSDLKKKYNERTN